jgi:hypothetical protein
MRERILTHVFLVLNNLSLRWSSDYWHEQAFLVPVVVIQLQSGLLPDVAVEHHPDGAALQSDWPVHLPEQVESGMGASSSSAFAIDTNANTSATTPNN